MLTVEHVMTKSCLTQIAAEFHGREPQWKMLIHLTVNWSYQKVPKLLCLPNSPIFYRILEGAS